MMRRVSKKDTDSFKSCDRSKGFTKIQTFDLRKPFCHKSCFVAYHHPMFILLVSKDPLGADDVLVFRRSFEDPNFIAGEVVQLILHGHHPIRVLKRFLYASGFNTRNKRVIFAKRSMFIASSYSLGGTTND